MAPPRHRFGAHDGHASLAAHLNERLERSCKLVGLHIVRVAAKAFVPPPGIARSPAGVPQATQRWTMSIFQMHGGQTTGQRGVVKLWIVMRTRDGANVHEAPYAIGLQQPDEALYRQGGVTNSENGPLRPICVLW